FSLKGANKDFVTEIVGYSFWILLQMIATQINAYADQVLLGAFVSGASVAIAIYSIGSQIVQYFQSIGSALGGVLMPGVVSIVERGATPKQLEDEMVRIGRMAFIILGTIYAGFLLYGKQFIQLWAGNEYEEGFFAAALLMLAYLFICSESIGTSILWAKNEHKEQAILKFVIVLVNIVLTVFLIRWNALYGATIGTFISLALGDVLVMNILFKKKIEINLKRYYKNLLKGVFPSILLGAALNLIFKMLKLSGWLGFMINVGVYVIIVGLLLWFFGMNTSEKQMIKSLIKMPRSKCKQ
ncbi:MAG: polysaccharide biosynthesis C-terminal domain-containing protein, partial [Lachnospiraceae bacterium]|nr:polysaccharide biosynthesis C-terminal domain-containing protein [Lachnospiraceae bacterium]